MSDSHTHTITTTGKRLPTMLRNDLILHLSQHDNDTVTVDVNGVLVDVDTVTTDRGSIVIVLDPEDMQNALSSVAKAGTNTAAESH